MRVSAQQLAIRILSHNIRYATSSPTEGEKPWSARKQFLLNQEAFICMQEVLHNQLLDIQAGLGIEWDYIGVGRDDGKEAGEYSPIFYRKNIWKVEKWRTVWLSETPEVPSKGWDAASTRIVTIGHFVHVQSKRAVLGMCTHLDDQGSKSRTESAKLILRVIEQETATFLPTLNSTSIAPIFLAGDLNSGPDGSAYRILNAVNSTLRDVKELSSRRYGDINTVPGRFTGFRDGTAKQLIDDVFVGPRNKDAWQVEGSAVLPNKFEDGVYSSDHRAIVADTVLTAEE